jgi:hypothetical protein
MRVEGQTSRTHHYALYACRALHTDAYDMGVEPLMHMICVSSLAQAATSRHQPAQAAPNSCLLPTPAQAALMYGYV